MTCVFEAQLQRVCGAFISCVEQFQNQVPQRFASTALVEINKSLLLLFLQYYFCFPRTKQNID